MHGFQISDRLRDRLWTVVRRSPSTPRGLTVPGRAWGACIAAGLACVSWAAARPADGQAPAAAAQADEAGPAGPDRLKLDTSDGVQLVAWHYPVSSGEGGAPPVALLVHDLDGSHATLEPLARALQQRGIAVVAPDLRGHGESVRRLLPSGAGEKLEARLLKKPDFEAMARSGGGRLRDQAAIRGDLEAVRGWIRRQADAGTLDSSRFFVVGSGLGAAVAMSWTVEDGKWQPIATGPQGREVRGLVLVSPSWTTRGFSIGPAVGVDLIRRRLPLLLIAGAEDRDAVKLYEQLKRQRPTEWYERRGSRPAETGLKQPAGSGATAGTPPTLYLLQLNTPLDRDRLASWVDAGGRGNDPASLIAGFVTTFGTKAAD